MKNGYYSITEVLNEVNISLGIDLEENKITIYNDNLVLLKNFINKLDLEVKEKRNLNSKLKIYIYNENAWNCIDGCEKRDFNSIILKNKKILLDKIKTFQVEHEIYKNLGIPYKYNILLHGLPGTGKTSLVTAIASELNLNIALITGNNLDLKSETEMLIALSKLPKNCCLLIEDFDLIKKINITTLLDGVAIRSGLITFLTSNIDDFKKEKLTTVVRPSRIDYKIKFTWASKEQIIDLYNRFFVSSNGINNSNMFMEQCKGLKITMAMLQNHFFTYRDEKSIFENIKKLESVSKAFNTEQTNYFT